jgi:hypothetical protein
MKVTFPSLIKFQTNLVLSKSQMLMNLHYLKPAMISQQASAKINEEEEKRRLLIF